MSSKLTTSDPVLIAERLKQLRAGFVTQWTATIVLGGDNGYQVAIADKDVRGYTETGITIGIHDYGKAYDVIDQVNEILFPGRTAKENMLIQLSTMSTGGKIAEFNQDLSTWKGIEVNALGHKLTGTSYRDFKIISEDPEPGIQATGDQDGGDPGAVVLFDNINIGDSILVEGIDGVFTVLDTSPDGIKVRRLLEDPAADLSTVPTVVKGSACWIPRSIIKYEGNTILNDGVNYHRIFIPLWFINISLKFWKHAK